VGMILILLSFTSFRTKLMEAIPENLKHAITAGIGLFIAFIGLRLTGIVTKNEANLVGLGDLHSAPVLLALAGLGITIVLMSL
ncbi:NCS2 family permease, partial [Vibrio cholerae]|nr:NCS2 family permease [Vibrio cholerae]